MRDDGFGAEFQAAYPRARAGRALDAEDGQVIAALQRLPLPQREVLVLHHGPPSS